MIDLIDKMLCAQLYIKTRAIIRHHEKQLKAIGLTYPKALVLITLDESGFVDEISRKLHLDTGTITPLLKTMEKQGYVERKRYEADERRVLVSITELGLSKLFPIMQIFEQTSKDICLSSEDNQAIMNLLNKMNIRS